MAPRITIEIIAGDRAWRMTQGLDSYAVPGAHLLDSPPCTGQYLEALELLPSDFIQRPE
jgi:hypothetical protein